MPLKRITVPITHKHPGQLIGIRPGRYVSWIVRARRGKGCFAHEPDRLLRIIGERTVGIGEACRRIAQNLGQSGLARLDLISLVVCRNGTEARMGYCMCTYLNEPALGKTHDFARRKRDMGRSTMTACPGPRSNCFENSLALSAGEWMQKPLESPIKIVTEGRVVRLLQIPRAVAPVVFLTVQRGAGEIPLIWSAVNREAQRTG